MKKRIIFFCTLLLALGLLLGIAHPSAASLKRVIILERADVGFPPLMETWEQQRLRLAQTIEPSPRGDASERVKRVNE
jgi:hypothetical protein